MRTSYRVGSSPPRVDGLDKASGKARYAADLRWPDMLHGATLRSPHPHARLESLGWKGGQAPPGVTLVTAEDIPGVNGVMLLEDSWPVLAAGKVRHVGEPVALVAAADRLTAQRALDELEVEYTLLEPVLTLEQAAAHPPHAVLNLETGDVDQGMALADRVVEGSYHTGRQEHVYLECQAMTAWTDPDGTLNVAGTLQNLYFVHLALVHALALPWPLVRVRSTTVGGGFGGKEDHPSMVAIHAALLNHVTGRPVSMVYDRHEDMVATPKRHPAVVHHRTGVNLDGELVAMDVDLTLDGGAYATLSPPVLLRAVLHATGAYRCPNVRIQARALATNMPPNGAMRGFGGPQVHFAVERQMDRIARELDLDPYQIRTCNVLEPGNRLPCGQLLDAGVTVRDCLEEVVARTDFRRRWHERRHRADAERGVGLSVFFHGCGLTNNFEQFFHPQVSGQLVSDGRVEILHAATELGQGVHTVLLQLACQSGGLRPEDLLFATPDSGRVLDSGPTDSSRSTMIVGGLVVRVTEKIRDQVVAAWAEHHGVDDELGVGGGVPPCHKGGSRGDQRYLEVRGGRIFGPDGELATFREAVLEYLDRIGPLVVTELYEPPGEFDPVLCQGDAFASYNWGAEVVEVEVDRDTLEVQPIRVTAACDVGKAVHPTLCRGQHEGAVLQALGFGLMEQSRAEGGHLINDRLYTYQVPTCKDAPRIDVHLLEQPYEGGPYGARGAGEVAIEGGAPAAVQAVENATGLVFDELPVTPEKLVEALLGERT